MVINLIAFFPPLLPLLLFVQLYYNFWGEEHHKSSKNNDPFLPVTTSPSPFAAPSFITFRSKYTYLSPRYATKLHFKTLVRGKIGVQTPTTRQEKKVAGNKSAFKKSQPESDTASPVEKEKTKNVGLRTFPAAEYGKRSASSASSCRQSSILRQQHHSHPRRHQQCPEAT